MIRAAEVLREAYRNLRSGTVHALVVCLVTAAATGALVWLDLTSLSRAVADAELFQAVGGATSTVEAIGRVDAAACERLATLPGVSGAGALRRLNSKVRVDNLPQQGVPLIQVSPGLATVLGTAPQGGGVWLSTSTAELLGVRSGDPIRIEGQAADVASIYDYPSDGRRPGLDFAVLEPVPAADGFDECWVTQWPMGSDLRTALKGVVSPGPGATTLGQLNASLGATFDGPARFQTRLSRWVAAIAALVGLLVMVTSVRLRRVELASALHAGVTRSDLLLIGLVETLVCVGAVGAMTLPVAVVIIASRHDTGDIVPFAFQPVVAAAWGMLSGTVIGIASTRESHLFSYVKGR